MSKNVELIVIVVIFFIIILLGLIASFIENVFFTLRIKFHDHAERVNIVNFLKKYHLKYSIHRYIKEVWLEKGLISIVEHIIKYLKLSRFFSDSQTIENAYFRIEYKTNNIIITNKITNKSIVNVGNQDSIWDYVIDNISEFFSENQLFIKLEELGYITYKQLIILKTEKFIQSSDSDDKIKSQNNYARNKRKIFDINNCTTEQLSMLPGITLIIAKKLIKYREDNGCFNTVTDFWTIAGLSFKQRIEIEKVAVLKAKKIKKSKFAKTLVNTIEMFCERIVDI